jgi:hypothetical protein
MAVLLRIIREPMFHCSPSPPAIDRSDQNDRQRERSEHRQQSLFAVRPMHKSTYQILSFSNNQHSAKLGNAGVQFKAGFGLGFRIG